MPVCPHPLFLSFPFYEIHLHRCSLQNISQSIYKVLCHWSNPEIYGWNLPVPHHTWNKTQHELCIFFFNVLYMSDELCNYIYGFNQEAFKRLLLSMLSISSIIRYQDFKWMWRTNNSVYCTLQELFPWFGFVSLYCGQVMIRFTHILQGYFTGTGAIIWLPQCQWSNPEGYG